MTTLTKPVLSTRADAIWNQLAPILSNDGRLQSGDELLFADYCELAAQSEVMREQVAREGIVVKVDGKKLQKNPAWNAWRDASTAARLAGEKLGIGAPARKKLGLRNHGKGVAGISATLGD